MNILLVPWKAIVRFPAVLAVTLLALLGVASAPARAADLYLDDEREIYLALDKLNALGQLPGFLANTRPYAMKAVRAAIGNAPQAVPGGPQAGSSPARWVAIYAKDTAVVRGTASISWTEHRSVRENNGGIPTPDGFSGGASILGRYEPSPWLSAHGKEADFFGESGDRGSRLGETAVEFGHQYLSLQAGKITTWYGPGRRGSLMFTNNAQPYAGVRLHDPVPIPIPGFFSFLGSVGYDLFLARLDEDRPIPNPILSGMRLAARPSRYLEIGISRAMHFGGEGHSSGFSAWWETFRGNQNDTGFGTNQLGGFDVAVTLPFKAQPVQLYLEMAGEDQAKGHQIPIPTPSKWAYLGGVFLPAILGNPDVDLRFEVADNHRGGNGPLWYTHPNYPHDHKGQVLGHPMGTDARDLWLQGHYYFLPSKYLEFTWNRTGRHSLGPSTETTNRFGMAFLGWFTPSLRARAGVQTGRVTNAGGVADRKENEFISSIDLAWHYSGRI